jgi:hypothetical protein
MNNFKKLSFTETWRCTASLVSVLLRSLGSLAPIMNKISGGQF